MKKILFIAPHLSTGGLPQYLVKKVELLKGEFEVYIIDNLSNSKIEVLDRITSITGVKPSYFNIDLRDKAAVKDFFAIMYQIILDKEKGPKLAGFMVENKTKVMSLLNQIQ